MNYLLDTHVLIELLGAPQRIDRRLRNVLQEPLNALFVSSASAWEIAIKAAIGRLRGPDDLEAELIREGIGSLDITIADALRAGALPRHHNDPFDRMLVAQAQNRGLTLVTRDSMLAAYGVLILTA
jgi:PIN domain nuclease of toxin-antitoxin system